MAIIKTDNIHYTNIANAIRSKTGYSGSLMPNQMASAIGDIEAGGGGGDFDALVEGELSVASGNASKIANCAFYSCSSLATASFPNCSYIGSSVFYSCNKLSMVDFSMCDYIGIRAFQGCWNLTTISLPKCSYIGSSAFYSCYRLKSLYLMGSSIPTLSNNNVFGSTPIGGYLTITGTYGSIYVPASLLTQYQSASYWSYFSSRFVGV